MRFKKALALLLTCSIIVTEVPVFAAEKEDSSGKENILAAKEDVKVDGVLKGNAPIGTDGRSVALHHRVGIKKDMKDYYEILTSTHRADFKRLHPWVRGRGR